MDDCEESSRNPENVQDLGLRSDPFPEADVVATEEMAGARPKVTAGARPKVTNTKSKSREEDINSRNLAQKRISADLRNTDILTVNKWGDSYLHIAIRKGEHKKLKNLLDKDESILQVAFGKFESTLLHEAVYKDCKQCLELLVDKGGDLGCRNNDGETLLHKAVKFGRILSVRFVIDNLKKTGELENLINSRDNNKNTPLNVAVKNKQDECAKMLIEEGADVNLYNKYGNTPLHRASYNGSRRCVDLLLKHKASVDLKNKFDETALHRATLRGDLRCVTRLLESGIDKNHQDENGNTALHNSSRGGHYYCTFHLLKAKADKDIKNDNGETAEDIVKRILGGTLEELEKQSYEWIQCIIQAGIQAAEAFKKNECSPHEILTYKFALTRSGFLGSGSFGTVHKGYDIVNEKLVAIKKINTSQFYFDSKAESRMLTEGEILSYVKQLEDPNVVKIRDLYNDEKRGDLWIVMEFCETTLLGLMKNCGARLSARHRKCIMIQALQGLSYLHGKHLVHRDIKVDNILILNNHPQWPWVKISDFSFAKDLNAKQDKPTIVGTAVGCRTCIAPELLNEEGRCKHVPETIYTQEIDIYSMGLVLVFTCLTSRGQQTFFKKNYGQEQLKNREIDFIERFFKSDWEDELRDDELVAVICKMLSFRSSDRPGAAAVRDVLRRRFHEEALEVDLHVQRENPRRPDDVAAVTQSQAAGSGNQDTRPSSGQGDTVPTEMTWDSQCSISPLS